jgi:hypothetical protein
MKESMGEVVRKTEEGVVEFINSWRRAEKKDGPRSISYRSHLKGLDPATKVPEGQVPWTPANIFSYQL